jgi:hypothetical protein
MQQLRHQFFEACTLAKLCRSPCRTFASASTVPLQLLHMDVAGPFRTATPEGGLVWCYWCWMT